MSVFTYSIEFTLEVENDIPILTCTCKNKYEIKSEFFNTKSRNAFSCPYCNKKWHFERNRELGTILLINPKINGAIPLKKEKNKWILNNSYYEK